MSAQPRLRVVDAGLTDYRSMWERQRRLFDSLVERKRRGEAVEEEYLILNEHRPVYTFGRHADHDNLLVTRAMLSAEGVEAIDIERGGDITFHGPGQLVVYPIIDLEAHGLGVKSYITLLEQAVIDTVGLSGIEAGRVDGATGVWVGIGTPRERKICAIGVKCSRFVTMHGLALNVSTDLRWFQKINPCGFTDKGVTSIEVETGRAVSLDEVKRQFTAAFQTLISRRPCGHRCP